ncbi:hypothetical protein CDAR_531881 [Caerostris darwini]|uniref:G-protein coupled receptors family 1 profile domain-containing protein n=1 Tax=Caerostris darwini TaxID=1538125 RepID=A0AAV4T2U0_9ARAC|nr:hypothetical protein CDAR_531881 [Caerostris darwini]
MKRSNFVSFMPKEDNMHVGMPNNCFRSPKHFSKRICSDVDFHIHRPLVCHLPALQNKHPADLAGVHPGGPPEAIVLDTRKHPIPWTPSTSPTAPTPGARAAPRSTNCSSCSFSVSKQNGKNGATVRLIAANPSCEGQIQSRRKAAKMLIAVVVIFGLCYLPVHLLNALRYTVGLPQNSATTVVSLISHYWLSAMLTVPSIR